MAIGYAELHVPGNYLIWIAAGAAVTAGIQAIFDLSLEGQIIVFVACCVLSCIAGYYAYRVLLGNADATVLNQRDRSMIGARGTVSSRIVNGQGKVRMGDSVWLAEGPDLPEGAPVIVTSVRGARLIVKPGEA
ncbi:MAG TPA: NfeD family protein [Acetobacteraceae bacterium]|nr:NfeD family protein [Acetobacteraceae bacterium]